MDRDYRRVHEKFENDSQLKSDGRIFPSKGPAWPHPYRRERAMPVHTSL